MDPAAKTASKETIKLFSTHYCELLCRKFFVNVPYLMCALVLLFRTVASAPSSTNAFVISRTWMYAASKMLLPAKTTAKFMMLAEGSYLAVELDTKDLPKAYGGNREDDLKDSAIVLKSKA